MGSNDALTAGSHNVFASHEQDTAITADGRIVAVMMRLHGFPAKFLPISRHFDAFQRTFLQNQLVLYLTEINQPVFPIALWPVNQLPPISLDDRHLQVDRTE